MSILDLTAVALGKKIKAGEITAVEATKAALAQIKTLEPVLNCYVTVDEEGALKRAEEVQRQIEDGTLTGPLAGVPVAIKDNMCTEGLLTTCSSKILDNFKPTYTAEAVRNLKSAAADTKKDLTQQMKEKDAELAAKDTELKTAQKNASDLDAQLKKAEKDLADLKNGSEAEKAELQTQISSLKEQLDEANAKITVLKAEKERMTGEKESLQAEIKKAQEDAAKKKAEEAEALKKAQEEEKKAKEELQKLKDAMTLKTGDTITVKGVTYRVTNAEAKTAEAYGVVNKSQKHIEVAATVKIKGNTCKVTAIADQAFAGMKKATKAVIGKNVSKIGKKAFNGDGKLKSITVKSRKLKTVGKLALKGINKKAVIRIPKSKKKAYRKLFKGKGQKKSVIVK